MIHAYPAFDCGRRDALLVILTVFQLIPARLESTFLEWAQTVAEANGRAESFASLRSSGAFGDV